MSERISSVFCVPNGHGVFVTDVVLSQALLNTKIILVLRIELYDVECGCHMINAVIDSRIAILLEREVERLPHLSLLEESGIPLCRNINHFIFGRM